MSFTVLVVPEDPKLNGHILKPLAEAIVASAGRPSAKEVFDPLLARHGDSGRPGAGRDLMIARSLRNLPLLYQLCPELRCLRDRIARHLQED